MTRCFLVLALMVPVSSAHAGLYYSGEQLRPLPAQWRGFLPDQRTLRIVGAVVPQGSMPTPPLRDTYAAALATLEAAAARRDLTPDEAADLGALHVRLGSPTKALAVLRPAVRKHPEHFRLAANLGTTWQLLGDPEQAAAMLEEAVRLAPPEHRAAETLQGKLIGMRRREGKTWRGVDDLFGVTFADVAGRPETGKLPVEAVALVQRLAWWLPSDARLLWLLAELAGADGDVRTAANILDGCVSEFALDSVEARRRRVLFRTAADAADSAEAPTVTAGRIKFRSPRVFQRLIDPTKLPKIKPTGINGLPWAVIGETELGPRGRPNLLPYLDELDGKQVALTGFISPIGGGKSDELTTFLFTENPVGCWFCEMPGPMQSVIVELLAGTSTQPSRQAAKLIGKLKINRTEPEEYPFRLVEAKIVPLD